MLFENPSPGRTLAGSTFFGELGLSGANSSSLCWVASNVAIILNQISLARSKRYESYASAFTGQTPAKAQYVDLMFSRTPGLASARPFLIDFSIKSRPPECST